jgi:hypothetical protein
MKPLPIALLALSIALPAASVASAASTGVATGSSSGVSGHRNWSGSNVEISTDSDEDVRTCADVRIRFGRHDAARAEQALTGAGPRGPLVLKLDKNWGAWVRGGDRRDWSVLACKAAETPETLAQVTVSFDRGELDVRGPSGSSADRWVVFYVIQAPRNAEIDAEASDGPLSFTGVSGHVKARGHNGPIGFRNCSGTIDARVENGPISLDGVSGEVVAHAENGPISISGGSGNIQARASNGPVSVRLAGDTWRDGKLDARAVNGPLSLKIPEGYRSRAVVESSGHSPFRCRAAACGAAQKSGDDEDRRVEFGEGTPVVQLSTVNGPVTVDSTRGE